MKNFYEFLEQRDQHFYMEMGESDDRRGFLRKLGTAAIGAAGAGALLGNNKAKAQSPSQTITCPKCSHTFELGSEKMASGKMTPEALYELVKPPIINFLVPLDLEKGTKQPKLSNSLIYKMNNIVPNYTKTLKEDFLGIATGAKGFSDRSFAAVCIKNFLNNKNPEENLKFIKKMVSKTSKYFFLELASHINHGYSNTISILDEKSYSAKYDGEELLKIILKETNSPSGSDRDIQAKNEVYDNIILIYRAYEKLENKYK